jgi:hypothetical protein
VKGPVDVEAIVEEHRAAGIPVDDSDIARIVGDDEVQASRNTARIWAHLSVSRADRKVATWEELRFTKETVFPDRVAVQVLPPKSEWYTIQEDGRPAPPDRPYAEVLHLWVCLTRRPTPDFRGSAGTL